MSNLTGRPIWQKGQPKAEKKAKPMRQKSAKAAGTPHPLRENAKGKPCTMRLPGCRGGTEHTVLAHYRRFGWAGAGQKPHDMLGAFACDLCHEKQERRHPDCTDADMLRAMGETLMMQLADGVIKIG
jgi:hypothetical protein